mmetsp:Transcript_28925/g.68545  ORF Transcript_28925/g.68545 Transcript_28925/m.68545 type:complete len:207 (+) Transcript_28925:340-960(+)
MDHRRAHHRHLPRIHHRRHRCLHDGHRRFRSGGGLAGGGDEEEVPYKGAHALLLPHLHDWYLAMHTLVRRAICYAVRARLLPMCYGPLPSLFHGHSSVREVCGAGVCGRQGGRLDAAVLERELRAGAHSCTPPLLLRARIRPERVAVLPGTAPPRRALPLPLPPPSTQHLLRPRGRRGGGRISQRRWKLCLGRRLDRKLRILLTIV